MLRNILNVFIGILLSSTIHSQIVVLERIAELMDENYTIDGTAFLEELDNGVLQLRLSDDYSTPAGPDVRIFLNNSLSATGGIEVVDLSAINHFSGALTVEVPAGVNIDDYQYIVFFCFQFSQLWASGEWSDSAPPGGGFVCEDSDVTLSNGTATIDICPSDGGSDILTFINTLNLPPTTNYAYLLTDENEILQEVITGDNFNFEGTSMDEQRVYGIHYDGTLQPAIGSIRSATSATGCFTHSSNLEYVEITKNACPTFDCFLSNTFTTDSENLIDICPSDGNSDVVPLLNNINEDPGEHYAYLITDAGQILQDVIYTSGFDFEGTSDSEQRVYGIHFDGDLNPLFGSIRQLTTASGCFTHSDNNNFLTVTKGACPPEFVCEENSTGSTSGNEIDICPSDGIGDNIELTNNIDAEIGVHYAYLITDENEILQEVVSSTSYDFEGSSSETQRVYGIHYDGDLIPQIGQLRSNTTASGCFQHSDENTFVTITKDACPPEFICLATTISTDDSGSNVDICPSDNQDDIISLQNNLSIEAGLHFAYLITDTDEIVKSYTQTNNYNFEGSGDQEERVYGIHFDGDLNVLVGENRMQTTATGCFEHSSSTTYLTITKNACPPPFECLATSVATADWALEIDICPTDGEDDLVELRNNLMIDDPDTYTYLITDENEIVMASTTDSEYNFEGDGTETQRVYGVHYDGDLNVLIGENRMSTTATGCFEHSSAELFLSVTKNACPPPFECLATSVATTGWALEIDICPTDGEDDLVELRNNLMIDDPDTYTYLITDENEIVMASTTDSEYNFEGDGTETQRVYGVHYDGDLNVLIGENRMSTTATGCFEHSSAELFLSVTKNACPPFECLATSVATTGWALEIDICPTDGEDDLVELRNNLMIDDPNTYTYLITDENEIVMASTTDSEYNFEGGGTETQRVYGVHYDGDLNVLIGENRMSTTATGCFEHSSAELFLSVTKNACPPPYECEGSFTATTDWASEVEICPTDGTPDVIELRNNIMAPVGEHYAYFITDANQILQEVVLDDTFYDFEGSDLIEQRVYGINYDGELDIRIGEDRLQTSASGCFIHSGDDFFLTINKTACMDEFECVESLTASTAWVTNIDICANDGIDDEILIQNNINTEPGEHYAFLLTDSTEILFEVFFDSIYNFEGLEEDQYRVYGVSYSGQLEPAIGEVRKNTTATDCYIHSGDNLFITVNTKAECIVATEDINPDDLLNLYPNPSNGLIHIDYNDTEVEITGATIYNSHGIKVKDVLNIQSIEIEDSGVYILQISTEKEKYNKRFVVIR